MCVDLVSPRYCHKEAQPEWLPLTGIHHRVVPARPEMSLLAGLAPLGGSREEDSGALAL